jgi:hypothetical protein
VVHQEQTRSTSLFLQLLMVIQSSYEALLRKFTLQIAARMAIPYRQRNCSPSYPSSPKFAFTQKEINHHQLELIFLQSSFFHLLRHFLNL